MFNLYYKWRYKRAQKARSFKLPAHSETEGKGRVSLVSYLSQTSVRGRPSDQFNLPNQRRRTLQWLLVMFLVGAFCWLVHESINALAMLSR